MLGLVTFSGTGKKTNQRVIRTHNSQKSFAFSKTERAKPGAGYNATFVITKLMIRREYAPKTMVEPARYGD